MAAAPADAEEVERRLSALDAFGWRLGLERMQALCAELGDPQLAYATVHVVGTNGKTSVARMLEGFLGEASLRAGASVSPHMASWRERISLGGEIVAERDFVRAAERVFAAAQAVEARREPEDRLSQFEIATAIAFVALAEAGVEVAVIEAGLGGRLDASNVLQSSLTVLTSIGLDHTDWLGETEVEIAAEKLAVLRPGTALLLGPVSGPVRALARQLAAERGARLLEIGDSDPRNAWLWADQADSAMPATLRGRFRRVDLEIAREAARYALGWLAESERHAADRDRLKLAAERLRADPARAAGVAAAIQIPGRLELIEGDPPLIFDVAHNPAGAVALAEALGEVAAGRPVIACLAVLADKDAAGIAAALAPALSRAICTTLPERALRGARPGAESHRALELAALFRETGLVAEACERPEKALDSLLTLARERGAIALVTGSHYLVALARDRLV